MLLPCMQEHSQQLAALRKDCIAATRTADDARSAASTSAAEAVQHAVRAAQLQACCERQRLRLKVRMHLTR
jgi:hypothetical protein